MKAFFAAFAGCLAAIVLVGVLLDMATRSPRMLMYLAAHKIVDGPGEAKRLILELQDMSPEKADEIVMQTYPEYRRVFPKASN